jgi:hypothetical protein
MKMLSTKIYYEHTTFLIQAAITKNVFREKVTQQPDVTEGEIYCLISLVLIGHNDQATGVCVFFPL